LAFGFWHSWLYPTKEVYTVEDVNIIPAVTKSDIFWDDRELQFTESVVMERLHNLKSDTFNDPDGIHLLLLKECAVDLAEPLSVIFEESFATNTLPSNWKMAYIVPIFKKGSRCDEENNRPLSLQDHGEYNKLSPQWDVTLLARRRLLPPVSNVAYASVTDDRRQRPSLVCPLYTRCRWASNKRKEFRSSWRPIKFFVENIMA